MGRLLKLKSFIIDSTREDPDESDDEQWGGGEDGKNVGHGKEAGSVAG